MIVFENGSFYLEAGEQVPFLCPKCTWPTKFDASATIVTCSHCKYTDMAEEFSRNAVKMIRPS